jgi:phospholipase A1
MPAFKSAVTLTACAILLCARAGEAGAQADPQPPPSPIAGAPLRSDEPPAVQPGGPAQPGNSVPASVEPDPLPALGDDSGESGDSRSSLFGNFGRDGDNFSIVSVTRGLSTHKPMYFLPLSYSPQYDGAETEAIFQISAKQRLFATNFYFAYTQRSFWQVYNADESRPFRESDYNPEFFYRWTPPLDKYWGVNADVGIEHESNGQDVPDSRSWNRIYVAPYRSFGKSLVYVKAWWRIPEDDKKYPEDPGGDDNPDIDDYYGYGELHWLRQIGGKQQLHVMVRGNAAEGRGAINIDYTVPSRDGFLFYQVYLWQGYGESLLDYNTSVTRIGIGIAMAR